MFKQKKTRFFISKFTFSLKDRLKECRIRIILTSLILLLGFFIGVFVAIRLKRGEMLEKAGEYGFIDFSLIKISSFSTFLLRFVSSVLMIGLLSLFSLNIFLYPLGGIIIIYRAYLVGLNLVILLISSGLSGLLISLLILLPCQIISLFLLSLYFCFFSKGIKSGCERRERVKDLLMFLILLLAVDVVETLLLFLFGANVILVI